MAGNGHKGRSRNIEPGLILEAPDEPQGLELPDHRPDGREWNDLTVQWYESMRTGPMAPIMGAKADWFSLLDLAMLKDDFYSMPKKSAVMAAEIRQREESFGITPAARIKLKIQDRTPDDTSVGAPRAESRGDAVADDVNRRRSMLRVVGSAS